MQRRCVKETDALSPGGGDGSGRLVFVNGAEHVAQRRRAEAQLPDNVVFQTPCITSASSGL